MSIPSSWRDLLKDVISNPIERERLAAAIGVNQMTLSRWAQGVSHTPRPQKLQRLMQAFPGPHQAVFARLLQEEYGDLHDLEIIERPQKIDYAFIQQIWEARATTPTHLQFWTLSGKILESALRQLDFHSMGMAITIAQLMPPSAQGSVRSLREVAGLGSPPWSPTLEHHMQFLGAESLAGYVVSHCRAEFIDDLRTQATILPIYRMGYEVSAAVCPIMYANRVAGCLIFSSTQAGHFQTEEQRSLTKDYTQLLAPVFPTDLFFEPQQIEMQLMPPAEVQYTKFMTFQQRVNTLVKEAYSTSQLLTRPQIEQQVWQQIEEELLHTSNQPV